MTRDETITLGINGIVLSSMLGYILIAKGLGPFYVGLFIVYLSGLAIYYIFLG